MFKRTAAKKLNKKSLSLQCFLALLQTSPSGAHVTRNCVPFETIIKAIVGPYLYTNVRLQLRGKQTGLYQRNILSSVKEFNSKIQFFICFN